MRSILIHIDVMPPAALLAVSLRRRLFGASALATVGAFTMPLARAGDGWQPAVLPQGVQRDIDSAITGQRYRIYLHIPATPAPVGGHSVLYALDGNATFPALALMARSTASRSARTGQVAPVIVGIGYPSGQDFGGGRARDYTPHIAPRITASGKEQPAGEGGADRFLDFIERELKPLIAGLAPLDPARQALFGHSYGGLCTLHALFTRPGMFQTYLAASPSIWYGERVVLSELAGLAKRTAALPGKPALMLSAGELEQFRTRGPAPQGHEAVASERRMVGEAQDLADRLARSDSLSRVQFHLLAGENHGSAMFPAMARGMEFFLG